jgi:hypothetical protein
MFGSGQMCQSCGMPLSKDENGGGTEANGGKSSEYCSKCYQNGAFVDPNMTLEQMQEICKTKMKEMHLPGFMASHIAKNQLPKLKRWNQVDTSSR